MWECTVTERVPSVRSFAASDASDESRSRRLFLLIKPNMPSLSSSAIDSLDSLLTEFTSLSSSSSTPRLPGTFLAVSSSSSPLYLKASGLRNVEDPSDPRGPVRTDTTKIPIASCTKLLAALSVLSLFDERPELGLTAETKVDQWLPELKRGTMKVLTGFKGDEPILEDIEEGKDITIGMLLSHVSGASEPGVLANQLLMPLDSSFADLWDFLWISTFL